MAFALVELENHLRTVVLKEDIRQRNCDIGYVPIFNKVELCHIIGCNDDYRLLNQVCQQYNRQSMTIQLSRLPLPDVVSTGESITEDQSVSEARATLTTAITTETSEMYEPRTPAVSITPGQSRESKKNFCKYCGQQRTSLYRHIASMHREEPEVQRYMALSKNNPKKRMILAEIRRDGNLQQALKNISKMVPARILANKPIDPTNYVACPHCKIILTKGALRRHRRKSCSSKQTAANSRDALRSGRALLNRIDDRAGNIMKNYIFPRFRDGPVKEVIRHDHLLLLYGNELCAKYRSQHHYPMIRNRLILMAKMLIQMKKSEDILLDNTFRPIDDFKSILKPMYYNSIIANINKFGEYDEETGIYLKPTLPTTIGTAIKYLVHLYIADCIKNGRKEEQHMAKDLLHLLTTSLPSQINKSATESLLRRKREKYVQLPSTSDIRKLNLYILKRRNNFLKKLQGGYNYHNWIKLSKYTLISILIFNRRRPGEIQRCHISDLKNIQSIDRYNTEIYGSLSENDKLATKNFVRFTIRGKLARGVPVLLHKTMKLCLDIILQYRIRSGVHVNNPYIFGMPQDTHPDKKIVYRHLIATDLLRDFSQRCGADNPETLRATQLRKHIATTSVSLNLKDIEITNLQTFLGHADKIHKEYYRQPIIVDDIVQMSKLLLIAQGGDVACSYLEGEPPSMASSEVLKTASDEHCFPSTSTSQSQMSVASTSQTIDEDRGSDYLLSSSDDSRDEKGTPKKRRLMDVRLGTIYRKSWRTPEKHIMQEAFKTQIGNCQVPSVSECVELIRTIPELRGRTVPQMQMWVRNYYKRISQRGKSVKTAWSTPERRAVRRLFGDYITEKHGCSYPAPQDIFEKLASCPELRNRTPKKIRSQIQHQRKLFKSGNLQPIKLFSD